jgi:DNA replication ATP-dependent helicase Dna2
MIDAAVADLIYSRAREIAGEEAAPAQKIPRLRSLLEELFRAESAESEDFLATLFARMEWVLTRRPAPPEVERAVHGLRTLAHDLLHDHLKPDDPLYLGALKGLCLAVAYFSGEPVPAELEAIWIGKEALTYARKKDDSPPELVPFARALVLKEGKERRIQRPDGDELAVSDLYCDLGRLGRAPVTFWDLFAPIAGLVGQGSTLNLFGLRRQTRQGRTVYSTMPDRSLVVLEPDLLADAGDLARFTPRGRFHAALWFASRCLHDERSIAVLRGNLVNGLLDRLLSSGGGRGRFEEHYAALASQQPLAICLLSAEERACLEAGVREQFLSLQKLLPRLDLDRPALEPAFLSDRYGLQGRLDVLAMGAEEWRRDVYELKSGKPPASGTWPQDRAQTTAYDLLLDSVSGEKRRGTTALLYPRDEAHPLRVCDSTLGERQRLLMNRNRLAALERNMGDAGFDPGSLLAETGAPPLPGFQQARIDRFTSLWQGADERSRAYVKAFLRFIAREKRQAWLGGEVEARPGFAALWQRSLEEKLHAFAILPWLEPRPAQGGEVQHLELARSTRTPTVSCLRAGDAVLLYAMDGDRCEPTRRQVTKCTITAIGPEMVRVRLRNPQLGAAHFQAHRHWALETDLLDHGFASMCRSLFDLLAASAPRRDLLLGLRRPEFSGQLALRPARNLDEHQRAVLAQALRARDYFLVQGPPGTGKTRLVLHELVRHLFEQTGESVLLAAFTNQAADEICAAVEPVTTDYIRLGREEVVAPPWRERLLSFACSRATGNGPEQLRNSLAATRIWISTVASLAAHEEIFALKKFDTMVVDEASQLLEPQLIGLLCRAGRTILIGDEKQLPAVVQQPEALSRVTGKELGEIGLDDLRLSLFERLLRRCQLQGWDDAHALLVRQARMHRDLAALPSRLFYGNRLELMDEERQSAPIARFSSAAKDPLERALAASRLVYIPSARDSLAQQNQSEVLIVKRVLETVRHAWGPEFDERSVGVITPFRRQIAAILTGLPNELSRDVTIDTVERFQGSEREMIILSMALHHPAQLRLIRSLTPDRTVDRKLNVALTRARSHVVLTGVEEVLRCDPFYGELLKACRRVEL